MNDLDITGQSFNVDNIRRSLELLPGQILQSIPAPEVGQREIQGNLSRSMFGFDQLTNIDNVDNCNNNLNTVPMDLFGMISTGASTNNACRFLADFELYNIEIYYLDKPRDRRVPAFCLFHGLARVWFNVFPSVIKQSSEKLLPPTNADMCLWMPHTQQDLRKYLFIS